MGYYSAIKRNEELIHATMWMNVKTVCGVKEARYKSLYTLIFHVYEISKTGKSRYRKQIGCCQDQRERGMESDLIVMGFLLE